MSSLETVKIVSKPQDDKSVIQTLYEVSPDLDPGSLMKVQRRHLTSCRVQVALWALDVLGGRCTVVPTVRGQIFDLLILPTIILD